VGKDVKFSGAAHQVLELAIGHLQAYDLRK
jgi:hypothetical protein